MDKLVEALAGLANNGNEGDDFLNTLKDEEGNWKSEEEIANALKGGITSYYDGIISKHREVADNKYKRGQKEALQKVESHIRTKYGINSEANATELIDLLAGGSNGSEPKKDDLTEDTVIKHPAFKSALTNRLKAYEEEMTAKEREYSQKLQELERQQLKSELDKTVQQILIDNRVRLEDENGDTTKRLKFLLSNLSLDKFRISDSGDIIPLDGEGERLQDPKTLKDVSLKDYIMSIQPYGVHKYDPNKKAATITRVSGKVSEAAQKHAKYVKQFGTYKELNEVVTKMTDRKLAYEYRKAWRELNGVSS